MAQFFSAVLSTLAIALLVGGSYFMRPNVQVRSAEAAESVPETARVICHKSVAGEYESATAYLVTTHRHGRLINAHQRHGDVIGTAVEADCEEAVRVVDLR